jgi:hypothetical protein
MDKSYNTHGKVDEQGSGGEARRKTPRRPKSGWKYAIKMDIIKVSQVVSDQ